MNFSDQALNNIFNSMDLSNPDPCHPLKVLNQRLEAGEEPTDEELKAADKVIRDRYQQKRRGMGL